MVERQEKDLGRLQVDMDELEEKSRSTQAALDSAYRYERCGGLTICYHSGKDMTEACGGASVWQVFVTWCHPGSREVGLGKP